MLNDQILTLAKRIKSIADIGLLYTKNEYDAERYAELKTIGFELTAKITDEPIEAIENFYFTETDYPTAKVDIRGLIVKGDQVLLAREADGKWSLPGGWGDIGYSPKETIIKEFKEETGLDILVERLLAAYDKKMHPHPPQPFYVYKMVFYCISETKLFQKGFDMLDVQYFNIHQLPEISEDRILKSQLESLFNKVKTGDVTTDFD